MYAYEAKNPDGDDEKKLEQKDKQYSTYLVTNKHVFERKDQVFLRFNSMSGEPAKIINLPLKTPEGKQIWLGHPDPTKDIAILPINWQRLTEYSLQILPFLNDQHVADTAKMKQIQVSEGDFVYVLGFPMGIIGDERNRIIVRAGVVSRIQDRLAEKSNDFLIDCSIFPGNSGGPVILKPSLPPFVANVIPAVIPQSFCGG